MLKQNEFTDNTLKNRRDAFYNISSIFKIKTSSRRRIFAQLILFLLLITFGEVYSAYSQNESVTIDYSKIVDRSPYTHSGQSVGEVLDLLKTQPLPASSALLTNITDLSKFDVDDEQEKILAEDKKIRNRYNRREISFQTATFLLDELENRTENLVRVAALQHLNALVEPFLEPYAFLLQDALESENPTQPKNTLIEVGDLFPYGEKQPAWANLLKTRRYFALSDGKGYVRIFLPSEAQNVQQNQAALNAFNDHYGAIRHILNWLRESSPEQKLTVDIYAYSNDMRNQVFQLNKEPYNFSLESELTPLPGTVKLDLDSIKDFLAKGLTIEGAYINDEGTLVLYGSKSATPPTLEGQPVELSDLATAYRAVFYSGYNEPYISLDPSQFPEQVNVNFGGRLADTRIGWVTLRSDMRFKTLSVGLDPVKDENHADQIRKILPDFRTRIERMMLSPTGRQVGSEGTRFWFYPDRDQSDTVGGIKTSVSRDAKFLEVNSPRFIGKAERQSASIGDKELENTTPVWTKATLSHLNRNYNVFSQKFIELRELDNVGRLLALFSWLSNKQKGELKIDLDSLLNIELPECKTPRRKAQLLAGLLIKNNVVEKVLNYSSLAQVITDERELYDKNPLLPIDKSELDELIDIRLDKDLQEANNDQYKAFAYISGGIDLSLRKTVRRTSRISPSKENFYSQLKQSSPETGLNQTPTKRVFRAAVKKQTEITPQNNLSKLPLQLSEIKKTTNVESREFINAKREEVSYKPAVEKVKWIHNTPEVPLTKQNSKVVFFGDDGKTETFFRTEENNQHIYKISKTGDKLVAENTVLSKENETSLINGLKQKGNSDLEVWRSLPETTDVVAFEKMTDGKLAVLRDTEEGFRLTIHDAENKVTATIEGEAAWKEIEKTTRTKLETASNDEVSFAYPTVENENLVLLVGKERKQFSSEEIGNIIDAPGSEAAKAFDDMFAGQKEIIVYRDALTRRAEQLGGSLKFDLDDPMKFVAFLRERFPDKRIYVDDEVDIAKQNRKAIGLLTKPSDVGMLAPEESFPVQDHNLIKNIKRDWKASGGIILENVLSQPATMQNLPNVLLLSGHNDANLTSYLVSLGEAGLLEGKVLFLQTCYTGENPNLNNHLIERYKPKAIFVHTEKISPVALESVLTNFGNLLKDAQTNNQPIHPLDLMEKSIELSLAEEDVTPFVKQELQKLKRGTFQISWINKSKQRLKQAE